MEKICSFRTENKYLFHVTLYKNEQGSLNFALFNILSGFEVIIIILRDIKIGFFAKNPALGLSLQLNPFYHLQCYLTNGNNVIRYELYPCGARSPTIVLKLVVAEDNRQKLDFIDRNRSAMITRVRCTTPPVAKEKKTEEI